MINKLNRFGDIVKIKNKTMVAKVYQPPRMGEEVFDSQGTYIGKVVSIFGPVKSPYVRIKMDREMNLSGYIYRGVGYEGRKEKGKGGMDRRN